MAKSVGLESREIVRMEKSFSLIEGSGEKSGAIPKHWPFAGTIPPSREIVGVGSFRTGLIRAEGLLANT